MKQNHYITRAARAQKDAGGATTTVTNESGGAVITLTEAEFLDVDNHLTVEGDHRMDDYKFAYLLSCLHGENLLHEDWERREVAA